MDVQEENQRLQRQLKTLMQRVEDNQQIQQRYQAYEQGLLSCTSLSELLNEILLEAVDHFNLSAVGLVIYDPDYSIRDLLEFLGVDCYGDCLQLRHGPDYFQTLYAFKPEVTLSTVEAKPGLNQLFKAIPPMASVALLPLLRQGELIASMHFGSESAARFTRDKASDFLVHLSSIAGVCLENCIAREQLKRQGQIDMLTQVANRRCFEERFSRELSRAERSKDGLSCMFVDVDYFKKINDTWGHQAGDLCLKLVAQQIQLQLRTTDILARYGGEEFVVVLPACVASEAQLIAERIRGAVESLQVMRSELQRQENVKTDQVEGAVDEAISLRVSVGVCTWLPENGRVEDLHDLGVNLLGKADEAMYSAKHGGRNQVKFIEFLSDTSRANVSP